MISMAVGLIFAAAAVWAGVRWSAELTVFLKGAVPILIFGAGIIGILAGVSGIRDRMIDSQKEKTGR